MPRRFADKVIAITGGASGIGKATASAAAAEGARVALADRNEAAGLAAARAIESAGGEAEFTQLDVTDPSAVAAWLEATADRFGGLDGLFNNAGINGPNQVLEDYSLEDFQRVIEINLLGVSYGIRGAIPLMRARGGGSIVNTGSTASLTGYATLSAYVAAKHGVLGLTRAVAREYAEVPIRVNCVCPGSPATSRERHSRWMAASRPATVDRWFLPHTNPRSGRFEGDPRKETPAHATLCLIEGESPPVRDGSRRRRPPHA